MVRKATKYSPDGEGGEFHFPVGDMRRRHDDLVHFGQFRMRPAGYAISLPVFLRWSFFKAMG